MRLMSMNLRFKIMKRAEGDRSSFRPERRRRLAQFRLRAGAPAWQAARSRPKGEAVSAQPNNPTPCPHPTAHYVTQVNKGSINMSRWQENLNGMYARGWKLRHVFEQDGNTVQVYEHHFHT